MMCRLQPKFLITAITMESRVKVRYISNAVLQLIRRIPLPCFTEGIHIGHVDYHESSISLLGPLSQKVKVKYA